MPTAPSPIRWLAYDGRSEEGLGLIEALVGERPGKSELLNMSCWYRARFDVGAETMVNVCNEAVERSQQAGEALDSRALAWFKEGDLARARADADAALGIGAQSRHTRYVRAFILREMGDAAGKEEVKYLSRSYPGTALEYARYGLKP